MLILSPPTNEKQTHVTIFHDQDQIGNFEKTYSQFDD